jgi:hypothetical protein
MNKKAFLSWLSLVMLVVTSAYVPAAAAAHMSTPMIGPPTSPGPGGNGPNPNASGGNGPGANAAQSQASSPQQNVRRIVGSVTDYTAGQSITIVDRQGNQFTFDLSSPLKIVPAHRANLLGVGAFVTIIAPNNVPNGKHIAVGIVIHRGVPAGFAPPGGGGGNQPIPGPIVNPPPVDTLVPGEPKPSLNFSQSISPPLPTLGTITGYTFPSDFVDWTMPIRVAAFETITIDPNVTFTPVGVVEIGSDQNSPLIYQVEIDLSSTGTEVQGKLLSITTTDTLDVTFQRMPQLVNPERMNSPYEEFQSLEPAPDSFSTIFSSGVCFVATTVDGPVKYCSIASASDESGQLSVRDNFSSQYANLQDLISPIAQQFGLENVIQLDQVISMQEDVQHIQDCASQLTQQACGADVVVAAVSEQSFEQQYNEKFGGGDEDDDDDENSDDQSSLQPTAIAVGVVKVLRPIDTSGSNIRPGDYRMDYWFDANGVFYAATITGLTTNNTQVTNQQIPAVPASLINEDGTDQPGAQISACRIIRRCMFWQSSCG